MIDENGNSPLHYACIRGHTDITWMLLSCDASLALHYNNNGFTPLHMASMHGRVSVLEEFVKMASVSFNYATYEGETVFHLAVRYGQYHALVYLVHVSNGTNLMHRQDRNGNTILHAAVSGGHHQVREMDVNFNYVIFFLETKSMRHKMRLQSQHEDGIRRKHEI